MWVLLYPVWILKVNNKSSLTKSFLNIYLHIYVCIIYQNQLEISTIIRDHKKKSIFLNKLQVKTTEGHWQFFFNKFVNYTLIAKIFFKFLMKFLFSTSNYFLIKSYFISLLNFVLTNQLWIKFVHWSSRMYDQRGDLGRQGIWLYVLNILFYKYILSTSFFFCLFNSGQLVMWYFIKAWYPSTSTPIILIKQKSFHFFCFDFMPLLLLRLS